MLSQKVQEPRPLKFPEPWFLSEQPKFVPRQPSSGPFFFQGGQWCQCVTSTSSTSSISKIWWSRASSTKSTWRTKRVSGNFCDLAMKFRLKLNHLFCFKMLLGWSFIVQWDSESVYIYWKPRWCLGCRRRCTRRKHTNSFCSKLMQIADKTHIRTEINILSSINLLFNVWLLWNTFELLWKASVLLACEGKHQGSRSDIWIFFKRKAVVSLLSLHPAWHDMGGVCGRSISIYMFLQNFRWWSQNCRWTRPLLGNAGPRWSTIYGKWQYYIRIWHVFLIRALRTESQITAYHSDIADTLLTTREPFLSHFLGTPEGGFVSTSPWLHGDV